MRAVPMTIAPPSATAPPDSPVPAPLGTMRSPCPAIAATAPCT